MDRLKQTSKQSDLIFRLFLYIPVVWAALLIAQSMGGGLPELLSKLTAALEHPFQIQWTDKSLLSILICTGAYIMGLCLYDAEGRRTRDGEEHGSAMWGSPKQVNAQFCQKQNKILTRHVRLGLDTHKHRRSLNVLVIGGSGAAKTRGYVKPNILEANTNYVITDPKMEVLTDTGGYLKQQGYDVRVLNLVNLDQSDGYNPFRYLRDEKDALKLVNTLIQATTPKGSHESDPFWTKSETALLQAIILMLHQEAPEYEQNFSMVMRVLEYAEVREDDDEYISPLDLLFRAIEHEDPESVALRQYRVFKQAAGKTAKSILISAAVRLAPFNLPQIKAITDHDDMNLYTLGERKCALYAVIPDNDTTFNFLVSLLYSQIFQTLYYCADQIHHGALPCHVHFILDEAPSVNLPGLPRELATMRSRNISCSTIIQNMAQIKELYKDSWETIPRQLGHAALSRRQRGKHPQVHFRGAGQVYHRHQDPRTNQRAVRVLLHQLPDQWAGTADAGRGADAGQPVLHPVHTRGQTDSGFEIRTDGASRDSLHHGRRSAALYPSRDSRTGPDGRSSVPILF